MESRIEELTSQLNQTNKDRTDTSRLQRSADKVARDAKFQLAESDRQRAKLEEERKAYEAQLHSLRQAMDTMVGVLITHIYCAKLTQLFDGFSKPRKATYNQRNDAQSGRPVIISKKL